MLPDSECVKIVCDILKELEMNSFVVKVTLTKVTLGFSICFSKRFTAQCGELDCGSNSWSKILNPHQTSAKPSEDTGRYI